MRRILMQPEELPKIDSQEHNKESRTTQKYFTKLQAFSLIIASLLISLVAGYFISDQYLWKEETTRLAQQLEFYKNEVSREPNESVHRVNLGYTHHLLGDNEEAVKQLRLAIDLDPESISAYFNLGLVYSDQGRYDDALIQAQKVSDLAPRDFKGHLLEGMVHRQLKEYDDALAALEEANKLMPANTDIIFEIGKVAEDQGKKEDAELLYKEALSYDPLYKPATEALEKLAQND
jgi:tetratricopeptide (TPR) repeat protein